MIKTIIICLITFVLSMYLAFYRKELYDINDDIYKIPISAISNDLDEEKILYIYNWIEYIDPHVIDAFEKITGIKVILDVFDSNETLEVKLLAGNAGYDLVFPSAHLYFARQLQAEAYQKLDKSRIPNIKNLDKSLMLRLQIVDKENSYAVPYLWGISGFAINVDKIKEIYPDAPIDSWELILNDKHLSKIAKCNVEFSDSAEEVFSAIFRYLGFPINTTASVEQLEQAFQLLKKLRPYIFKFNSSSAQDLFSKTACASMGTSGDIRKILILSKKEGRNVNIKFILPKEGAAIWIDICAIPRNAKHLKNAHAFINFLLHPKVIAKITNFTACANAVTKSKKYIRPDILNDKVVYPDQAVIDRCYSEIAFPFELERQRTRMFTKIKSEIDQ